MQKRWRSPFQILSNEGGGVTLQAETPAAYCLTMLVEAIYYAEYASSPRGRENTPLPGRGEAPSQEGTKSPPRGDEASYLHGRGEAPSLAGEAPFLGGAKLRPWEGQSPPTGRGDAHQPVIDYGSFIKDYTSI